MKMLFPKLWLFWESYGSGLNIGQNIAPGTGVPMDKMLDHFKPGSPVSNVVGEGVVSNVYIKTQDGWMNVTAGRVAQHKGWQ